MKRPSLRSDTVSLHYPLYSLTGGEKCRTFIDTRNDTQIEIHASESGCPSMYDKDVMIICESKLRQLLNSDPTYELLSRAPKVEFTFSEFCSFTGRLKGGGHLNFLDRALKRLLGASIISTLTTGGVPIGRHGVHIIDEYELPFPVERRRGRPGRGGEEIRIKVQVSDWVWRAVVNKEVLLLDRQYFDLTPLERRLYEIGRKFKGHKKAFEIGIDRLLALIDAKTPRHKILRMIEQIDASLRLPGLDLSIDQQRDKVIFTSRDQLRGNCFSAVAIPLPDQFYEADYTAMMLASCQDCRYEEIFGD